MQAVVVEDADRVVVREVPDPPPTGPYQALVKVVCASICNATDAKIAHRQLYFVKDYPTMLGHEGVGRVTAVGEEVRSFHLGDLVSRPRATPPPGSGLYESWGAFAQYGLVTDTAAMAADGLLDPRSMRAPDQIPAPPGSDPVALTQMITLRETLSLLRNLGVRAGESIVIFGAGPVGVACSLLARQIGLDPVIVVARRDQQLERALTFGRATHAVNNTRDSVPQAVRRITGRGADWAVEAIGTDAVMRDALACLAPEGKVALYGVPHPSEVDSPLRRGPHLSPAGPEEGTATQEIFDWVGRGLVPAREFVSHELPMAQVATGLHLLQTRQTFKVLLWMDPAA